MGLTLSTTPKQQSPLVQPAISGDIDLIKTLIGRHIASYENVNKNNSQQQQQQQQHHTTSTKDNNDPKLQQYVVGRRNK